MSKNQCPHCKEPTFSFFSRFNIGPVRTVECTACHKPVGVSGSSWLAILIMLGGLIGSTFIRDDLTKFTVAFASVGLGAFLYAVIVNLVPIDDNS